MFPDAGIETNGDERCSGYKQKATSDKIDAAPLDDVYWTGAD